MASISAFNAQQIFSSCGVADLKAISDLHATGIESLFFGDGVEQRRRKGEDKRGVVLVVNLPAGTA